MATPVKDERNVTRGVIDGGVYRVEKKRAKHYLRSYHGWGINEYVWARLLAEDVETVEIVETDTGTVYRAQMSFLREQRLYTVAYDVDRQYVLRESWFLKIDPEQDSLF